MPKGTHVYRKLESDYEIRVLKILPGNHPDKIECYLIPSALPPSDNAPSKSQSKAKAETLKYDALSYWWGEPDEVARQQIMIYSAGGHMLGVQRGTFYIRKNLEAALRQLRSNTEDVYIWVDAICINQEDKKEKMAQVSRMHEIYTEATKVCVWLGAGGPDTKKTFKFLTEILDLQKLDNLAASGDPEKWWLVVRLMRNKWFSRRWVIQELTLARDALVCWGASEMSWSNFADAIALFIEKHDEIKEILNSTAEYPQTKDPVGDVRALGANTLVNATNELFRKSEDGKIHQRLLRLEVLVTCRFLAFEATDPRDTIYAVLSIAKDTSFGMCDLKQRPSWMRSQESHGIVGKIGSVLFNYCFQPMYQVFFPVPTSSGMESRDDIRISPDYDKNIIDVCADFMDYCIETSESLDILCRHWAPTPQKRTLRQETLKPSAAPDTEEKVPTWIPSIKGHAFGGPEDALNGRINGDSFVGHQERQHHQHYNASANLPPWWKFGKCEQSEKEPAKRKQTQSQVLAEAPTESTQAGTACPPPNAPVQPQRRKKLDGTLFIKGFRLGEITKIFGRVKGMIQQEALEMAGWPTNSGRDKVPDQLWRTLVADRGPNGTNAPSWYRRACLECLKYVDLGGDLFTDDLKTMKGAPKMIVSFLERVQRVVWNRRFFHSTKRSLFGLAPPDAKIGDCIYIIFGCTVPVVLREFSTNDDENYFEFVGECYVNGYMDGEAIDARHRPAYPYTEVQEIMLR